MRNDEGGYDIKSNREVISIFNESNIVTIYSRTKD